MKWSTRDVLRRLRDVTAAVPPPAQGLGAQTSVVTGFVGYAWDALIVQQVSITVLGACLVPAPDPEFGDDGFRDECRHDALTALDSAERWAADRKREDWVARRQSEAAWTNGSVPYVSDAPR